MARIDMAPKRILNIGCGSETYGTDFVDMYPQRKEVVKCDIESGALPYGAGTFDEVYCSGLFEHIKNPNAFIEKTARLLKKGGKFVIITDNASYWVYAMDNSLHRGSYERDAHPDDRHYALYTEHHLTNHCRAAGLKIVKVEKMQQAKYETTKKKILGKIVNSLLLATPFRNMAYMNIRIEAVKE